MYEEVAQPIRSSRWRKPTVHVARCRFRDFMTPTTLHTRHRRWRAWGVVAALVLAVWCLRSTLLSGLARRLVVDQEPSVFNVLWIGDEAVNRRFDLAAEQYRQTGCRIAIARPVPTRVVQLGIEPSAEELARRELAKRGVPADALLVVDGPTGTAWTEGRLLADWLAAHPQARVLMLCKRFRSAAHRQELDRLLQPDAAQRVAVRGVRDRRYDENTWWHSRVGVKEFFVTWLGELHSRQTPPADAECYEQALRHQWRGTP